MVGSRQISRLPTTERPLCLPGREAGRAVVEKRSRAFFCNLKLGDRKVKKLRLETRPVGVCPVAAMLSFRKNKLFFAKVKSLSDNLYNKESDKAQNRDKECQKARHFGRVGVEWQDFARLVGQGRSLSEQVVRQ